MQFRKIVYSQLTSSPKETEIEEFHKEITVPVITVKCSESWSVSWPRHEKKNQDKKEIYFFHYKREKWLRMKTLVEAVWNPLFLVLPSIWRKMWIKLIKKELQESIEGIVFLKSRRYYVRKKYSSGSLKA